MMDELQDATEQPWRHRLIDNPLTAPFDDKPCELLKEHRPIPTLTEYHHSKPVYLQNRLYGRIVYGADTYLCANCHDSVHEWIYWLMGERRAEPRVGYAAKAFAAKTVDWYNQERKRIDEASTTV